jgi:predicted GIY-YIG superfamily endonuclease
MDKLENVINLDYMVLLYIKNNYDPHKNITYNGSTNNLVRRIRQHNGII